MGLSSSRYRLAVLSLLVSLLSLSVTPSFGQLIDSGPAPAPTEAQDPLGRGTPRGLVEGLLSSLARGDYDRAAAFIQLTAWPEEERAARGPRLARQLQTVLDRYGQFSPFAELSNQPAGRASDDLDSDLERVGTLRANSESYPILARRVSIDDTLVWQLAEETMMRVPALAFSSTNAPIDGVLPTVLRENTVLGAPWGHWMAVAVSAVIVGGLVAGFVVLATRYIDKLPAARQRARPVLLLRASLKPIGLALGVLLVTLAVNLMGISIVARTTSGRFAEVLLWIAVAWLIWSIIDGISEFSIQRMSRRQRPTGVSAVTLARRAVKTVIVAVVILAGLDTMGVDMTAGIAALGIGGLALALGAQKTIENFVGSLTLVIDRPVQVGDFCRFGDILGTVEDIGMRSTRIRTLDRTLVTVPNGEFSTMQIENYSVRDKFLLKHELTLQYDTTNEQMKVVLAELRKMLEANPSVVPESARVRFIGFGADALIVELLAYVFADDWAAFLEIREAVNLEIIRIVEDAGSGFAFPTRTIHLTLDDAAKLRDQAPT